MLLATDVVTVEDRERAREVVHFHDRLRWLAVGILRAVNYGAIDLIDAALGAGHGRAVLVATHEGVDRLLGAALDLMESCAAERVFADSPLIDPMGLGELVDRPGADRMRSRLVRIPLEGSIVRLAAAGNDLVNAHLLLAWEANCATSEELACLEINPASLDQSRWATIEKVRHELPRFAGKPLALLPAMWLTARLESLLDNDALTETRLWRDELAHRERLGFAESPAFGRASLWRSPGTSVTFPKGNTEDPSLPSIADRRRRLVEAGEAVLLYAEALWAVEREFFASLGVEILDSRVEGVLRAKLDASGSPTAPPRTSRDPAPLLMPPRGWA